MMEAGNNASVSGGQYARLLENSGLCFGIFSFLVSLLSLEGNLFIEIICKGFAAQLRNGFGQEAVECLRGNITEFKRAYFAGVCSR